MRICGVAVDVRVKADREAARILCVVGSRPRAEAAARGNSITAASCGLLATHTARARARTDSLFASPFPRMPFALPQPGHTRACRYFTEHCAVRVQCGAVQ
jgi:hypothetical protein